MHDGALEVRMAEIDVGPRCAFAGQTVAGIITPALAGTAVVAVKRASRFLTTPSPDLVIETGDVLIVLGTDDHLHQMAALAEA